MLTGYVPDIISRTVGGQNDGVQIYNLLVMGQLLCVGRVWDWGGDRRGSWEGCEPVINKNITD